MLFEKQKRRTLARPSGISWTLYVIVMCRSAGWSELFGPRQTELQ